MATFRRLFASKRAAAAIVIGIGGLLSIVHLSHLFAHDKPPLATIVGVVLPLVLSVVVVYAGYWTLRQDVLGAYVARLVVWTVVGGIAMGVIVGTITAHQYLAGQLPDDAFYQLATAVTGGTLGGVLVGRYDAQLRRRSDRIRALQEATGELVTAETAEEVCERVVEIARRELELPLTAAWLYDEERTLLEPVAVTDEGREAIGDHPAFEPGESLSWAVFEDGEPRVYPDVYDRPERHNPDTRVRSEIILPLGSHGVLNVGSREPDAFDDVDVSTARLLASTAGTVLDRVEREMELRSHQRTLETQNERLEEFASIVSHDLRNPLSVAEGHLQLASEDCDSPALSKVEEAHRRMDGIITDLLGLARAGQTIEETEPVDLAAVAADAWGMVETTGGTLEIEFEAATIDADRSRLGQLLENLFRNAIEHGTADADRGALEGGTDRPPAVTVRIGLLAENAGFYVEDDGPGIPPEDRDRVFTPGYTTNEGGTGLGLAVVTRIVAAHGWSIEVVDATIGGTRFEVRTD